MTPTENKVSREEILPLLGVVKKSGTDVLAFCPSHGDGQKHGMKGGHSLVLHQSGVLECMAGCKFADVITTLRERAGIKSTNGHYPSNPYPGAAVKARAKDDNPNKWMTVATYEYRDPVTLEVVALKNRQERPVPDPMPGEKPYEKKFTWRTPTGAFTLEGHTHGVNDMALWGAELIKNSPGRVFFTEGEGKAQVIREHGELAVSGGWGASTQDWTANMAPWEALRGRHVILWPDNDAPGRAYMQAVRRTLRGIAKSIAVITAPVGPKGDAVDYFRQQDASIENLLADVLTEPVCDIVGEGSFTVRIPTEGGVLSWAFTQMATKGAQLECNLAVSVPWSDDIYDQWINLKSQSTREGLKRALEAQFGKETNWMSAISTAYSLAKKTYDTQDRGVLVAGMTTLPSSLFLIDDIVPLGSSTVWFGKGSSGKTALTKRAALEVAMGGKFLGRRCVQGGVLFIDYEDPDWLQHDLRRHLAGMGYLPETLEELPIFYWPHRNEPVSAQAEAIRRFCEKHEIVLVIVDSALSACGGEPEKSEPSAALFNALQHIGRTSIIISHVGHAEYEAGARRPYGHINWENRPRRVWAVHRDDNSDTNDIDFLLICTKTNRKMPKPIGGVLSFKGEENRGPIDIGTKDVRTNQVLRSRVGLAEQIRGLLLRGPLTIAEIMAELDLADDKGGTVRVTLNRMKDVMPLNEGGGRGNVTRWAMLVPGESRAPAQQAAMAMDPCSRCGVEATGYTDAGQPACDEHVK